MREKRQGTVRVKCRENGKENGRKKVRGKGCEKTGAKSQ